MMLARLRRELTALGKAIRSLDPLTSTVLVAAPTLALIQHKWGSRKFFRRELGERVAAEDLEIYAHAWDFLSQAVTGFVLPVLILVVLFRRRPAEMGLGLGDWRLAGTLAALYAPLAAAGCWMLSAQTSFQDKYPRFGPAEDDWQMFLLYEAMFLAYWLGWEYLWRGFVQFGTARTFGYYAIFVQMIPFAILHFRKPTVESFLAIPGALLLGALVWRCRAFWIAIPIHAWQMMMIDLMCSLRARSGARGIGPSALLEAIRGAFD
jgi:uncharacterized protein